MDTREFFAAGGPLATKFPGYEPRDGQVAMAMSVEHAIASGRHLFVEAGTGTGKSVGYLAPAILAKKRTIVVTANIALQEQLVKKDLPMLAGIMPEPFDYVLVKGVSNYLCVDKTEGPDAGQLMMFGDGGENDQRSRIIGWSKTTRTGDVSDLPFTPEPAVWADFSVSSEECKGRKCPFYEEGCHSVAARRRARQADVIVTNYHLFFAHLALRADSGIDAILPPAEVVILDEGHRAPDIARDFFGFAMTPWRFSRVVGAVDNINRAPLARSIKRSADSMFEALERLFRSSDYRASLRTFDDIPSGTLVQDLKMAYEELSTKEDHATAASACHQLLSDLEEAILRTDPERPGYDRYVYYLEERGARKAVALCRKPIEAADALKHLFHYPSVVVTSATLSTFGRFDYVTKEFGAPPRGTDVVECESPFDFRSQALLVIPDMPLPTAEDFPEAVAHVLWEAVQAADGRTLALFTSYRNLNRAYEYLIQHGCPYTVLRQGDAPRSQLMEQFKADTHSVLLGTESFAEGMDCPGETLSCVVIDRLPFASPDDPVMDAISQRDNKWFFNYSIPRAIIAFKQRFGRLIRTCDDRGVCVILDARIVKKGYGANFIKSLPIMMQSQTVSHIRPFLAGE